MPTRTQPSGSGRFSWAVVPGCVAGPALIGLCQDVGDTMA